jgi:light-regulated signal transduction histidine kinase (bacteriophytochrome)
MHKLGHQLHICLAMLQLRMRYRGLWSVVTAGVRSPARDGAAGAAAGVAAARSIVEAHEGQIQAGSTPGQGTTLTVTLPVAVAAPVRGPANRR